MKKVILVLMMIAIVSPGFAYQVDPWTTQDTVLQLTFTISFIIDVWQTYTFLYSEKYQKQNYYETNLILGENPSKVKLFTYNSVCVLSHTIISFLLPQPFRMIWQCIWIAVEIYAIRNNYEIGVRIKI
jgi:hypothetical protein